MAEQVPYQPFSTRQQMGAPGQFLSEHANPSAFGEKTGEAAHGLGQTMMGVANEYQDNVNKLYANDASTQGMVAAGKIWDEYGRLEGRAAHLAWPEFQQKFIENYKASIDAAPNAAAKQMLAPSMKIITDRYLGYGEAHATKEYNRWWDKSHIDRADELANQAARAREHSGELMNAFADRGAAEISDMMKAKGYSDDEIKAEQDKYRGKVYKDIIESKANAGDVHGAKDLLDQLNKDGKIDHGSARVAESFLKPKIEALYAQDIADRHLGIATKKADALKSYDPSAPGAHWTDKFAHLESGSKDPMKGLSNVSTDTHGSKSYGNFGLNSLPGNSMWQFQAEYGDLFGLKGLTPGSAEFTAAWKKAAQDNPKALRAAEVDWHVRHVEVPAVKPLMDSGAPESITRDPRVQQYLADRYVQHGNLHIARTADQQIIKEANGDPIKYMKLLSDADRKNIAGDFKSYLSEHNAAQGIRGLNNRIMWREQIATGAKPEEMKGMDVSALQAPMAQNKTYAAQPTAQQPQPPDQTAYQPRTPGVLDLEANRPTLAASAALSGQQLMNQIHDREAQNVGVVYDRTQRQAADAMPNEAEVMAAAREDARRQFPDNPHMQNLVTNRIREAYSVKKAAAADEARFEKKHKELLHNQMLQAEDEYIKDANADHPQMSAKNVLNDPRLAVNPQTRERLIKLYAKDADDGMVSKSDSAKNTRELSKRITEDHDPNHIVDAGVINQAYYNNQINRSDWDKLSKEFKEFRTEDGNPFLKAKNKFYESVKAEIIKPMPGMPYPPSNLQYYEYTRAIDAKIAQMRKEGKTPAQIEEKFTTKPGGFADPEFVRHYQADVKQIIDYQADAIKRGDAKKLDTEKFNNMWRELGNARPK